LTKQIAPDVGFIGGGARGLHHFTEMVGADAVVTINWAGTACTLIENDPPVVQRFRQPTPDSVIDELTEKIPDYRKGYFIHELTSEEYENFGPVLLFRAGFEAAWGNALGFIKENR
jgi:transaldolase